MLERDAALARVGRVRRWVIAATAALTAGFASLVYAVTPGRSGVLTHTHRTAQAAPALRLPAPAGPGALGLQGPAQVPGAAAPQIAAPAPAPAAGGGAVSGAS